MAKSGGGRVESSWNSSYGLQFYWSCSQSVAGNYSDFTVDIYGSLLLYATISVGARADSYIEIGGNKETKTFPAVSKMDNPAKDIYLGTKTQRIYHDAEGKLSNVYLYAYWPIKATISGTYRSSIEGGINTGVIDTIPRASKLNNISNFNLGNNINISFTKYSSGFVDDLYITLGGVNVGYRGNISSNYNLILTQEEINLIYSKVPNANSTSLTFTIFTYSSGTQIGSSVKTATASVINSNPTFSNFDYLDSENNVVNITGNNQIIVKNKSILRFVIDNQNKMISKNYATPKNYVATCDDKTIAVNYTETTITADLGRITSAGVKRLSIKAVDSRGNSTTVYKDINIVEYDSPISNIELTRLNNFENQTTIKINGSFNLLTLFGVSKNIVDSIKYRYSELGTSSPNNWTNMEFQILNNLFIASNVVLDLDNAKAFNFQFEITDKFESIYITKIVDIGKELMFLDADTGDLEVMGDIYAKGKKLGSFESMRLPTGTNLNSIQQEGLYYCPANADAATMSNLPVGSTAFSLLVEKHAGFKQTFTVYHAGSPYTWIRNFYNGTWGVWRRIPFISYGTGNPGTLLDGEIYIKY